MTDTILTSLVWHPINFVANNSETVKTFWRQIAVRVPARTPGETIRNKQTPRQAAGNHPPSAIQYQRRRDPSQNALGISAEGTVNEAIGHFVPHAFKAPQFAGDHTARDHPFPSRTRKLSLAGPMVLHGRLCGRLGDRRQ